MDRTSQGEDAASLPPSRPNFGPLESSSVIGKLKTFMPIFVSAPLRPCDPLLCSADDEVRLSDTQPEEGAVEMRVQLGIYDVNGECDEKKLAPEIPIVNLPEPEPLIREL